MSSRSPSPEPLYTLGQALGLWPTRRRPHDTSTMPRPDSTDQDKLVHAQHLFLLRLRATGPGTACPCPCGPPLDDLPA